MNDIYANTDEMLQQKTRKLAHQAKRIAGVLFRRLLMKIGAAVLSSLLVYITFVLIVLGIAVMVYSFLFVVPRSVSEANDGQRVVHNTGIRDRAWSLAKDEKLIQEYESLGEKWLSTVESTDQFKNRMSQFSQEIEKNYLISQEEQARPFMVPWSILAAVDRITGNPTVMGGVDRRANPSKHYEALKPTLVWEDREVIKIEEWYEQVGVDDFGNPVYDLVRNEYRQKVKLLKTAETFEGNYAYSWEPKTLHYTEGIKNITITYYESTGITRSGPYYIKLKELIKSYGLNERKDTELVLELAMAHDPEYAADTSELLGGGAANINIDLSKQYFYGPLGVVVWPLDPEYNQLSSPFGWRIDPFLKTRRYHTGIDIPAPKYTSVYSMQNGKVIYAGAYGAYGNTVIVDHGQYKSFYCHLARISIAEGSEVTAGTLLGGVGSTGRSTGNHLHFEVRKLVNGKELVVNPLSFYQ